MLLQKVAQNVTISFGYFIFSKNHNELPKVAQLAKTVQSGHPGSPILSTRLSIQNVQTL
jgi:hypothetical protein